MSTRRARAARGGLRTRLQEIPGLYDLHLRFVSVHSSEEGLVGKLTLTGVGYERGMAFVRHYLESLRWTP